MALMRYEPFNMLNQLQREMNRLFESSRRGDEEGGQLLADWAPAVDIKEEVNQFVIHADLPGVEAKDIDITLEHGVLTLKGQRTVEKKDETENYRRVERVRGTFLRRFSLPEAVDAEKVSAKCKDGVLEVIVPKRESAQPRRIAIEA
ncbi:MAG TPA: Hsp20/alpha crystallin family protein [Candidatus Competibacteraceae bacterium]|nr:MAG: Hsp20/alpha crystallin family protein [Candidatus Competibacteraceae bacterium]HOB62832.1 Hsp20/alpha crystallin family protein [Candidatus Competibacteraceae bacterium]HQA26284.1 Hsp20/alpha crystallin family protein [Candidatus Competibacteraceae bacterium]HQD57147.1 Hsp20/alpha crystallin family protein [Candidatus Competibacteraceae bacterium]